MALLLRSEGPERPTYPVTLPRIVRRRYALAARARPVVAAAAVALMAIGIASRAPLQMDARESRTRTTTAATDSQQLEMQSLRVLRQERSRPPTGRSSRWRSWPACRPESRSARLQALAAPRRAS